MTLASALRAVGSVHLHWLDNFARYMARQSIYLNQKLFREMLWTAHGVKVWKQPAPVSMSYVFQNARICSAMPPLSYILSNQVLSALADEVCDLALNYHPTSLSTVRNVRRIPLKPLALTEDEHIYMSQSLDGLSVFEPVDIYSDNVQSYDGLVASIAKCQALDGFGLAHSHRPQHYSMLLLDVSTFWMAFHVLYSYTGMTKVLNDLFLFLGPWHIYMYAHVAVWSRFRSSYLAAAFFALYPNEKLFLRPKLSTSTIFFTWLRASYPHFRKKLIAALNFVKYFSVLYDIAFTQQLKLKKVLPSNPYRKRYLKLYNLYYLFDYVLPCVADYGSALKLNDWNALRSALIRLMRFYFSFEAQADFW